MSTCVITTRTGHISDLGKILPLVGWQRRRLRVAARLFLYRDSVVYITATQSRPSAFHSQLGSPHCQIEGIRAWILAVKALPLVSGMVLVVEGAKCCSPGRLHACKTQQRLVVMTHSLKAFSF